jgi:hypothetical protein
MAVDEDNSLLIVLGEESLPPATTKVLELRLFILARLQQELWEKCLTSRSAKEEKFAAAWS